MGSQKRYLEMIWLACLSIVFHYVWQSIRGYRGIGEKRRPSEIGSPLGLFCTVVLIGLTVYLFIEIVQGLVWFQNVCRQLLGETLADFYAQNVDACKKKTAYIIVCSLCMDAFFKDACQLEYWMNLGYQRIMKFLKWVGQQVMNVTAVCGLYYAVFYNGSSALFEKNKFLMVLVAFCASELLLYDVFEFSTECSQKLGRKAAVLRKADSLWEGFKSAFLKETCPCPNREGLCCCCENVTGIADKTDIVMVVEKHGPAGGSGNPLEEAGNSCLPTSPSALHRDYRSRRRRTEPFSSGKRRSYRASDERTRRRRQRGSAAPAADVQQTTGFQEPPAGPAS